MLRWVHALDITRSHLELIAKALLAAPEAVRISEREMVLGLQTGQKRLFEFENGNGLVVVHESRKRLCIDVLACRLFQPKPQLVAALRRLAADYKCDTIATTVFDQRFADVIILLGGRVEAIDLVLSVELEDGREN